MNDTILRFGYPETLVREYAHWVVLVRIEQITLGALVLACKEEAQRLSEVSAAAYGELKDVMVDIETALGRAFDYDKINYLALMMVDKEVHFHVLPRYARAISAFGGSFDDPGWPAVPELGHFVALSGEQVATVGDAIKSHLPAR